MCIPGVNISSSVDAEYLEAVDDDKYLKGVNFSVLQCINDVVIPNITQCPEFITPATLVSPSRLFRFKEIRLVSYALVYTNFVHLIF